MTLNEAIHHCEEVAEQNEFETRIYDELNKASDDEYRNNHCQCAADHRQLAEWLTDYKKSQEELAEAKRLLKLALEDMNDNEICYDIDTNTYKVCTQVDKFSCNTFKWRYTDEAEELLNG